MNTARRLAGNTVASLIHQISTPISSFLLVYFIAKYMGPSGLGQFSTGLALFFIFQCVSCLGFPYLITREVSQKRDFAWKLTVNSSIIGLFFSLFAAFIMCLIIRSVTDDAEVVQATYILSIALIPFTLTTIFESVCRGYERLDYAAIALVAGNALKVALGLFVLFKGYGIYHLYIAITIGYFIVLLFNIYFLFKCIPASNRLSYSPDFYVCKWIAKSTPVLALILITGGIRLNFDIILLTKLMSPWDVGIYSAGSKLANMFRLGTSSYIMALQPVIFRLSVSKREVFQKTCIDSIRYLFIFILPIVVFVILLSEKLVLFIFKQEFLPSAIVFRILIVMVLLFGMNQIFANVLISKNDQKVNLIANVVSAFISILLNILMVPKFGYIGAGIAAVLSYTIIFAIQHHAVKHKYFNIDYFNLLKKPFLASIIMGIALYIFKNLPLIALVAFSPIFYVAVLIVLKTFTDEDIDFFRKIWFGKKNKSVTEVQAN